MKTKIVRVPWPQGLHLLPAATIVRAAQRFRSSIHVRVGSRMSEATSILGLVVLCATLNTEVRIEIQGEDEREALHAVAACFESDPSTRP
ncbi:HPr family phosphocarrier protein [Synoicihabitans lomoniglobus]|uniref:HPr family phosphocarrier protein n=1 Tax=Synoicihabitans lomoniglobus TaxID=2909285 RepID=A0AAE9ZXA4_9BACT|nr:HPr family phosphocarrier protein [Opitutaceae bacterium LMO-M01]WED65186.1 HPr family phosphocarrier protein [Opitutaceae bacterium LMO-M01]